MADSIERIEGADVMDIVLHNEVTAEGDWYNLTVYFWVPDDLG